MEHDCAQNAKLLVPVKNAHPQIPRIVFRVVHYPRAVPPIFRKTKNRRALLHDPPFASVVTRLYAHPFNKILFASLDFQRIVKRRITLDLNHRLCVLTGRETSLVYRCGQTLYFLAAIQHKYRVRRFVPLLVDDPQILQRRLRPQENLVRNGRLDQLWSVRWCQFDRPRIPPVFPRSRQRRIRERRRRAQCQRNQQCRGASQAANPPDQDLFSAFRPASCRW